MKTVYLAGPITGTSYKECTDWRQKLIDDLLKNNLVGWSPMRAKAYLAEETSVGDSYESKILSCQRGIFARDMNDCRQLDAIIANVTGTERVSIGTVMEITAFWWQRKPIVLIMEKGNIHNHAMIREACPFIVHTLDEAVHVMTTILCPVQH